MQDEVMIQKANPGSIRNEMIRAQNVAKDLESWVAELEDRKQHAAKELRRMKKDHDALERHERRWPR